VSRIDTGNDKLSFDKRTIKTARIFVFDGGDVVYLNAGKTIFDGVIHKVVERDVLPSVCGK
jgi:hypothetical protein